MRLVYPEIEKNFEFGNGTFNGLVLENPVMFYRVMNDLYNQSCGNDGDAVLSENDEPIPIAGNLDLLTNFVPFEINRKNLLNKLIAQVESQALLPDFYERSQRLMGEVEKWLIDLSFSVGVNLEFPRLSIPTLIKSTGICLNEDVQPLSEKLLDYIELSLRFGMSKGVVLMNLRSFLDDSELEAFTNSCCQHDFPIMLIDNRSGRQLSREIRTVIDADLCEI